METINDVLIFLNQMELFNVIAGVECNIFYHYWKNISGGI